MKHILILLAISTILLSACKVKREQNSDSTPSNKNTKTEKITEFKNTPLRKAAQHTGRIQKQGMTTYQYGSHILKTDDTFYALRSKEHDLNDYVGKKVKVISEKIAGYPISGGPEFILVLKIEILEDTKPTKQVE